MNKQIFYSENIKGVVNNVAQNDFGKDADVIYSSYMSPVNFNIFKVGN